MIRGEEIEALPRSYNKVLNAIIGEIWECIWWKAGRDKGGRSSKGFFQL
jgi:hypothetical protein